MKFHLKIPTNQEIFDDIYKYRKWVFGSGSGSIGVLNKPFLRFINDFLVLHPQVQTILDIGCGDWQIGRHFELDDRNYIGCDVSTVVLNKTKAKFSSPHRRFLQLDAVTDALPDADLVIIKDVLHHLSNDDVSKILQKLPKYRYVIIQNDICKNRSMNKDIQNGKFRPLDITTGPFNAKEYLLTQEYTEGLYKPWNILRGLFSLPPIRKGIFVKQK